MIRFILIIGIIGLILNHTNAQSTLIPNSGFEDNLTMPDSLGDFTVLKWNQISVSDSSGVKASPDYFHSKAKTKSGANLPKTGYALVEANEGKANAGIIVFDDSREYREYLSIELLNPLTTNKVYELSFWITNGKPDQNLMIYNGIGIRQLGVLFSEKPVIQKGTSRIMQQPQLKHDTVLFSKIWKKVRFTFKATAQYYYMTIGNFQPNSYFFKDSTIKMNSEKFNVRVLDTIRAKRFEKNCQTVCYYYIDNFNLIEKKTDSYYLQNLQLVKEKFTQETEIRKKEFENTIDIIVGETVSDIYIKVGNRIQKRELKDSLGSFPLLVNTELSEIFDSITNREITNYITQNLSALLMSTTPELIYHIQTAGIESLQSHLADSLKQFTPTIQSQLDSIISECLTASEADIYFSATASDPRITPLVGINVDNIVRHNMASTPLLVNRKTIYDEFICGDNYLLPNLLYVFDKAIFINPPKAHQDLKTLASYMTTYPSMTVELHGHTQVEGLKEQMQTLSEDRVKVAKTFLVQQQGISENRIGAIGHGKNLPLYTGKDSIQKAKNRRVEVHINCPEEEIKIQRDNTILSGIKSHIVKENTSITNIANNEVENQEEYQISNTLLFTKPANIRVDSTINSDAIELAPLNVESMILQRSKSLNYIKIGYYHTKDYWYKISYSLNNVVITGWIYGYCTDKKLEFIRYEHLVKAGETLESIANLYNISVEWIKTLNPRDTKDLNDLVGKVLFIKVFKE